MTAPNTKKKTMTNSDDQKNRGPAGLRHFMKWAFFDFGHAGTLFPSSQYACTTMLKRLPEKAKVVVEYGAGNGVITRRLLDHLPASGQLVSIELNDQFYESLTEIEDPRLTVWHRDVNQAVGDLKKRFPQGIDAFVSGIPFSFMPLDVRHKIAAQTADLMAHGGRFIVYQNSPQMMKVLKQHFDRVRLVFEPRNIPPYFIMVAEKH